jgi:phosphate transport system substrate-binding protein
MKYRRCLWALLAAALASGCGGSSTTSSATVSPTMDVDALRGAIAKDFPKMDGSTTARPLLRLIGCDLYGVPCVWSAPASAGVERAFVPDPAASIPAEDAQAVLDINTNGTHGAYVNLVDGKTDIIIVARAPSADELTEAAAKNVEYDVRPVALDAFVFLANTSNPVASLPLATIRDIYSGKITTWQEAGVTMSDPQALIHPYQRERNSGSQEQMQSQVMKDTPVIDAPDMIVLTMLGPFNAIGGNATTPGDPLGIGYTFYYYAGVMFANPNVKMLGVDGVVPSSATIASRTYPLYSDVYMVTRKDLSADSTAAKLRDWLLSPDGQRVVEQSGYVPLP